MNQEESTQEFKSRSRSINAFTLLARNFGAIVTRDTIDDWSGVLEVGNVLDMVLDHTRSPDVGKSLHITITDAFENDDLGFFSDGNTELDELLTHAFDRSDPDESRTDKRRLSFYAKRFAGWPTEQRSLHLESFEGLRTESANKRVATEVNDLIEIRVREARLCNNFLRMFPETVGSRRFYDHLGKAMPVACLWDEARDLPDDYKNGITGVPPTIRNRTAILSAARKDILGAVSTIDPQSGYAVGKLIISLFRDRYNRGQSLPFASQSN